MKECLKEFWQSGLQGYCLADKDTFNKVIEEIADDFGTAINPTLLQSYSGNLLKGVRGVFGDIKYGDRHYDILNRLERNVARFAAFKAYHATQQVKRALTASGTAAQGLKRATAVLTAFNRYQSAEYNTAVSRSRTAKQWVDFNDKEALLLFPNLRWLPSRSASPREQHMPFYNHVWPKTDPFWASNQPGNLWNCKCDWEETSDAPDADKVETHNPPASLEGNPGETGEAFTDKSVYFTANGYENGDNAILSMGQNGFYSKGKLNGTDIRVHFLHGAGEVAGNISALNSFCKNTSGIKSVQLLPIINGEDLYHYKEDFYPKWMLPRGKGKNADAVIEWVNGEKWVVDFKYMAGNGGKIFNRLKEDAYYQADYAIIKFSSQQMDLEKVKDGVDRFMKGHREFKGVIVYSPDDMEVYRNTR